MRPVRLAILCAAALGFAADAAAQTFDGSVLRGAGYETTYNPPSRSYEQADSPVSMRWEGLYIGGQMGRSWGNTNFGQSPNALLSRLLDGTLVGARVADWVILPSADGSSTTYGGFIGYNTSWEGAMLGLELNYNRMNTTMAVADSLSRTFLDNTIAPPGHNFTYATTVSGTGSVRITDLATFRARAGWEAGAFMPYAFGGVAVGRVDVQRTATIAYTRTDNPDVTDPVTPPIVMAPYGPVTVAENKNGRFAFGWTAGAGIDVAILPNVFLRGEWEYVQLLPVEGVRVHVNSVRAGVGVKF